jgi:regulatory protein
LHEYGLNKADVDQAIAVLISDNFLNEERFAESFARGKFRIKHWGKNKIKQELKMRKVSDYSIKKALKQIEDKEYLQTLEKLIHKKWKETKEKNDYKKKYKVLQYVVSRGFESDIANELIKMTNEEQ